MQINSIQQEIFQLSLKHEFTINLYQALFQGYDHGLSNTAESYDHLLHQDNPMTELSSPAEKSVKYNQTTKSNMSYFELQSNGQNLRIFILTPFPCNHFIFAFLSITLFKIKRPLKRDLSISICRRIFTLIREEQPKLSYE